jgi:hypothetical protein
MAHFGQTAGSGATAKKLKEKAYLYEGHGFSRAVKGLRRTALAAEVRSYAARKAEHVPQLAKEICGFLSVLTQTLKPSSFTAFTARLKWCPDTSGF